MSDHNKFRLSGEIIGGLSEHHIDSFIRYGSMISVQRKSDVSDLIPVEFPAFLLKQFQSIGNIVTVSGEYRTSNVNGHLVQYALVDKIEKFDSPGLNEIFLHGFVCKRPVSRQTPFGKYITDICIAVDSVDGRLYIPVIIWGKDVSIPQGSEISLKGRIQSRTYTKSGRSMTAYEISSNSYTLS